MTNYPYRVHIGNARFEARLVDSAAVVTCKKQGGEWVAVATRGTGEEMARVAGATNIEAANRLESVIYDLRHSGPEWANSKAKIAAENAAQGAEALAWANKVIAAGRFF